MAVVLLIARFFVKSATVRLSLIVIPGVIFAGLGLFVLAAIHPGPFAPILPYQTLGTYPTTDTEGGAWVVEVSYKYLSNMIPPGMLPRIRLIAKSSKGTASFTHDTHWRFGVSDARPVAGGIEVFTGEHGVRFELKGGDWRVSNRQIARGTSLWEDQLRGKFKVGMTRDEVLELVRAHRREELPDLQVRFEGDLMTQHSLDREAAFYVDYSANGVVKLLSEVYPSEATQMFQQLKDAYVGHTPLNITRVLDFSK